ncbi:hypothetical protein BU26DRAFT_558974 [Trematosphaeria pertusa]|uniref:Uncharacterized protein n=1 Tax=Trematosphaeria pertusa TaxID=390896 RepID=A0A6A6IW16_9PLEO|nr:uncharacterized protein BU26DRAFT_558974 [Trematosphaeria pertusa]KAF2254267.1 hypothetical protein BU26DRAFT_558974 [Trematosphaeria pertusa]
MKNGVIVISPLASSVASMFNLAYGFVSTSLFSMLVTKFRASSILTLTYLSVPGPELMFTFLIPLPTSNSYSTMPGNLQTPHHHLHRRVHLMVRAAPRDVDAALIHAIANGHVTASRPTSAYTTGSSSRCRGANRRHALSYNYACAQYHAEPHNRHYSELETSSSPLGNLFVSLDLISFQSILINIAQTDII